MKQPLLNDVFLKELDAYPHRVVHIKIVSLDFNENPRSEIEGYATGGSISINGTSSLRRTCNVTLMSQETRINELYWALDSKFALYVGLTNDFNEDYDKVIWFPQGTYIITSYSQTLNNSGYTISISGKDKMCLLDGSIGGQLFADHDFGKIEVVTAKDDKGYITESHWEFIPIKKIIQNAVHTYAQEPAKNIIVNDLDDCSVKLVTFRAKNYVIYIFCTYTENDDGSRKYNTPEMQFREASDNSTESFVGKLEQAWQANGMVDELELTIDNKNLILLKRGAYSDTVGYELTELIYNDDLIITAGGTITQMLDKICSMLGEFEYFYNVDGQFIFQRKHIYHNISWSNQIGNQDQKYFDSLMRNSQSEIYEFNQGALIESFQNKPKVEAIRNDFSIWGERTSTSGATIQLHMRYAIDEKPSLYFSLNQNKWYSSAEDPEHPDAVVVDWREVLHQMALDDLTYGEQITDILMEGQQYKETLQKQIDDYTTDLAKQETALEQAKSEFTQEPTNENGVQISLLENQILMTEGKKKSAQDTLARADIILNNNYTSFYDNLHYVTYYPDMLEFWPRLYDITNREWEPTHYWNPDYFTYTTNEQTGAEILHLIAPEILPFWIDFEDLNSDLGKYRVSLIGRRPKVVKEKDVKAIFFRETPNVVFVDPADPETQRDTELGYDKLQLSNGMGNFFRISTQGKSAQERLDELLYEHTYLQESVTISCVPIYYLEPNYRIRVFDETAGIDGIYVINQISLQLNYDGMMSITASRIGQTII